MTRIYLLPSTSPVNHTQGQENKGNDHQLLKEALDYRTNSPYQHLKKCIENSTENMHTDVSL